MNEKRLSRRKLINARVSLHHPSFGVITGHTRDISDGGIFVNLKDIPEIPVGSKLKVQLMDSANTDIMFNAKMAHSNASGIGLVFINYEIDDVVYEMDELRDWKETK